MAIAFLSARWSNLILITYAVPPALLTPHLPRGVELDTRDGQAFASLVAFDFEDTRVLGVAWPGFRRFAEMNLRFYVRQGQRRGVMFIREIVPQWLVAAIARGAYNEPYVAAPLHSATTRSAATLTVEHRLRWRGALQRVSATGSLATERPAADSAEHFFKEHEWGFGRSRLGRTISYQVIHPHWDIYPLLDWQVDLDWAAVYGPQWAFLQAAQPYSTVFAVGSAVQVYLKRSLGAS